MDASFRDIPFSKRLEYRVSDAAFRSLIWTFSRLPYERRVPLMGAVFRKVIGPAAGYLKRAKAHLAFALPDLPAAERDRIALACLDNMGRNIIETYATAEFLARSHATPVTGPGWQALQDAVAAGRAVILQSGHFGSYEAARAALFTRGIAASGIYREMSNPYFHRHYVQTLVAYGGTGFPRGAKGMRGVVKLLRDGGQLIILNDQHTFGAPVFDFLGRPAHTATSPAELALRFDAVVIPYFGIRQPNGLTFRCEFEAPIPLTTAHEMTQEMNDRLAARIRQHPEQWFWVPRRWRADSRSAQDYSTRAAPTTGP